MRFPIFVSAQPLVGLSSIKVMVGVGNWKVINEDPSSVIEVFVNDMQVPTPDHSFTCYSTAKVHAKIIKAGSKAINVHVESYEV
jgi:hypothetical protein